MLSRARVSLLDRGWRSLSWASGSSDRSTWMESGEDRGLEATGTGEALAPALQSAGPRSHVSTSPRGAAGWPTGTRAQ